MKVVIDAQVERYDWKELVAYANELGLRGTPEVLVKRLVRDFGMSLFDRLSDRGVYPTGGAA